MAPLISLSPISLYDSDNDSLPITSPSERLDIADDVADRLRTMKKQEDDDSYRCTDYFTAMDDLCSMCAMPVNKECRRLMCEWYHRITDHFEQPQEIIAVAMSYLDRFLCTNEGLSTLTDRKLYRKTAMTTLYMASKTRGSGTTTIEPSFLAKLSRGSCSVDDIVRKEREILKALKWKLSEPTSFCFVQNFMLLLPSTVHPSVASVIEDQALFQSEIAVADFNLALVTPSCIAFASILNAMAGCEIDGIDESCFSSSEKEEFVRSIEQCCPGLIMKDMKNVRSRLITLLMNNVVPTMTKQKEPRDRASASSIRVSFKSSPVSSASLKGSETPFSPASPVSLVGEAFA